jgi:hypothetical protein
MIVTGGNQRAQRETSSIASLFTKNLTWIAVGSQASALRGWQQRQTHFISIMKTDWFMLFRDIITVYLEYNRNCLNKFCGQNAELLDVKADGTCSLTLCLEWLKDVHTLIFVVIMLFIVEKLCCWCYT